MAKFARRLMVSYSSQQMYELVDDINSYPEFLPWCERVEVVRKADAKLYATLHLRKGPLAHSFTTSNIHDPKERTISARLAKGPLSALSGKWTFVDAEQGGCVVSFEIEYKFATKVLERMLGPLFAHVYGNMVDSFAKRAHDIYKEQ